ncbi:MAG: hypothetical protein KJ000_29245 [Pirellulaceae bacterium]|nr:hypothetical protein [Pirellulaceae bacterium]
MKKSTRTRPARKPKSDFPLTRHPRGQWCKKVGGKLHYFGRVQGDEDGQAALEEWLRVKDDLLAGRKPRPKDDTRVAIKSLANAFLNAKQLAFEAGEIGRRTLDENIATCERLARVFGSGRAVEDLTAEDFERLRADIASKWGPVRLGNEVQRVRSVFGYGWEAGILDKPVRFGPNFKKPSRRVLRVERAKRPARMFEADEIKTIMGAASVQMRCMILLGCNAGYGNHDCAGLPLDVAQEAIRTGWLDWARPKTGVARRCKLWPETVQALQAAIDARPAAKVPEAENLVFVTKYGKPWGVGKNVPVSAEFKKILDATGLHKEGRGFYALRHVAETIGGGAKDQVALNLLMGHVDETMSGIYRESVADSRLEAIAEQIRGWLFPPAADDTTEQPATLRFPSAG